MLRSRKYTALIVSLALVLMAGILSGCGVKVSDRDRLGGGGGGGGNDFKPGPSDLLGKALDFGGHWEGNCEAIVGGIDRKDCSMTMNVKQMTGFAADTITIDGTIMIGNQIRSFSSPVFAIDKNDLRPMYGSGAAGSIGSGAFRIFEEQFKGLSAKALRKDKDSKPVRLGILAGQAGGFSLESASSVSCANSNCFAAELVLKGM